MNETVLKVEGMTCENCVKHVTEALKRVPGVQDVDVKLESGLAHVLHDGSADVNKLIAEVEEEGYTAAQNTTTS